jgi:hypothetical protein
MTTKVEIITGSDGQLTEIIARKAATEGWSVRTMIPAAYDHQRHGEGVSSTFVTAYAVVFEK